ncbi:Microcystin LR degradation protein MlrC [Cryphonectria parasitica EP155]|uniref:Microcystin LR degradation protein MlrC n=1 Tax=Cryphonectria parasitica (strain ATCC 38755 / EP155) TaxID=660469 RepID=A0A9P4Y7Q7_CRYP1|nr:Microcystin LR degradation protein MlrC [Cryphonectria parasitica EP155]KAF3768083.1 Microcystin LR degradation protein MlrC [Cryphonectria parasitica EP155]
MSPKPTIAIAGLAIETSTFSPARTQAAAFHARRGDAEVTAYHAAVLGPNTPLSTAAHWRGALIGHALPGGQVTREAFDSLATEMVARLEAIDTTPDGLWFDIHGAMCVEGLDDAEAELLRRVRKAVGAGCLVSASMDLHGNVSRELAHACDLLTCYRTAPHVDVVETRVRACENLLAVLEKKKTTKKRPLKAWVPVPILLPGEQTSTRDEPAASIYAAVPGVAEGTAGVLDAAIWVGYAWADEPRNRAAVVVTGWEKEAVAAGAEKLARLFWENRKGFHFVAPTGSFGECLATALERIQDEKKRPFFISDSGDNPTAGGSGDVTWGLTRLLEREDFKKEDGPVVIYASVPGPEAIDVAVEAGVGAVVTVTAGAMVDDIHAGPLTMTGRVHSIKHGDKDAVTEVVLQVGSVHAILTKLRKPYHKEKDFTDLDLRPREAAIVIVKIGYLEPELYDMSNDWMLGLTPGGVDQDLERLGHARIRRPMWPFDKDAEREPDLTARWIPMSDEPLEGPDE